MGSRDDVQINQLYLLVWCQLYGERYPYNIIEIVRRAIFSTSESNAVASINYCRQCILRFIAVYKTQVKGGLK